MYSNVAAHNGRGCAFRFESTVQHLDDPSDSNPNHETTAKDGARGGDIAAK